MPSPLGHSVGAWHGARLSLFLGAHLVLQDNYYQTQALDIATHRPMYVLDGQQRLMQWLEGIAVRPRIVGEFDDGALMKAFGQAGIGIFAAPSAIAAEVRRQYGVVSIGSTDAVIERFYAISVERRLSHPAVVAISSMARKELFGSKRDS